MEQVLYIPTSSLNFNNIVSCESISPANIYAQRNFGIKRFVDIYNGAFSDVIVLSDTVAYFERPKSDVEDHPMIVKVSVDENMLCSIGNGFYTVSSTIFITPYNTEFLFFNEHDRLVAESLSEHSVQVKFSQLYIPRMRVVSAQKKYDFSQIITSGIRKPLNSELDDRINRLKGMLYGYYIGVLLSTDKYSVKKLGILLDVQNEFSAIISSGVYGQKEEQSLREYSTNWMMLNPIYIELQENGIDVKKLKTILDKYSVRLPVANLGLSSHIQDLSLPFSKDKENPAMEWIHEKILQQQNEMRMKLALAPLSVYDGCILSDGYNLVNIVGTEYQEIVKHWFNKVLLNSYTPGIESSSRMELAEMITDATVEIMGDTWRESRQRVFLNKLRHHIANGDALDVEWNNDILSSIAAVILKGEEWDDLLRFMQRKGMYDYRLAFAMYGALTGYANMPRDFVDILFESVNVQYASQVYGEFYGQLFGSDLPIELNQRQSLPINGATDITNNDNNDDPEIEQILKLIKENSRYSKSASKFESLCEKIKNEKIKDWKVIRTLGDSGKVKGWKALVDDAKKGGKNKTNVTYQENLFGRGYFFEDSDIWNTISKFIPDDKGLYNYGRNSITRRECIKRDLEWFQKMMRMPQKERGYDKKTGWKPYLQDVDAYDNVQAINAFSKMRRNEDYWKDVDREKIKQHLLSLYCCNDRESIHHP